jgi:hypothetical protein
LVPGSGPSVDGSRWIDGKLTKATRGKPARPFLVDNARLGKKFCERFLAKLNSLRRRGKLELGGTCAALQDASAWAEFTASLVEHDWCVFIERPPTSESTPEHVLKYLARYMTGGPISDRRLVSSHRNRVTFLARNPNKSSPQRQVEVELSGVEFTRCWTLHILPKGFTKTRCYGGYSSTKRADFIALCNRLRPPPPSPTSAQADPQQADPQRDDPTELAAKDQTETSPCCSVCGIPMQLSRETYRPSWRELFYGPDHQPWFET